MHACMDPPGRSLCLPLPAWILLDISCVSPYHAALQDKAIDAAFPVYYSGCGTSTAPGPNISKTIGILPQDV